MIRISTLSVIGEDDGEGANQRSGRFSIQSNSFAGVGLPRWWAGRGSPKPLVDFSKQHLTQRNLNN